MGVYIKGMNIPEMADNTGIKMELRKLDGVVTIGIMIGGYSCAEQWSYYHIAEIPEPHGRLIDADELQEAIGDAHFKNWGNAVLIVKDAPTVIDAEGEE